MEKVIKSVSPPNDNVHVDPTSSQEVKKHTALWMNVTTIGLTCTVIGDARPVFESMVVVGTILLGAVQYGNLSGKGVATLNSRWIVLDNGVFLVKRSKAATAKALTEHSKTTVPLVQQFYAIVGEMYDTHEEQWDRKISVTPPKVAPAMAYLVELQKKAGLALQYYNTS